MDLLSLPTPSSRPPSHSLLLSPSLSPPSPALPQHAGIRKDARSIGIGRGTKCR
ncbi:hypothetical protein [Porphyromonas bennonis]|uniref:hypothetical protein n=1 Tax=Porphyromonas bennonis TaxID=501496 RepID=UPI000368E1FB|nr:hypothetical protein [Porphyromonas bennonis]